MTTQRQQLEKNVSNAKKAFDEATIRESNAFETWDQSKSKNRTRLDKAIENLNAKQADLDAAHAALKAFDDERKAQNIESCSVDMRKLDHRCYGWAFIIRANEPVPAPFDIEGAEDFGKPFAHRSGEDELFEGDVMLLGEANHHTKLRGWMHRMYILDTRKGSPRDCYVKINPTVAFKDVIKRKMVAGKCTMPKEYLKGAGENAAMARIIHALRNGMTLDDLLVPYKPAEVKEAA